MLVAVSSSPDVERREIALGQRKIELDRIDVVERGDHRTRRHQGADADLAQPEHTGKRRGDDAIGQLGAQQGNARLGRIVGGACRVGDLLGHGTLADQIVVAIHQALGVLVGGLRLGQGGNLLTRGQFDEHVTGIDALAIGEIHLAHGFGDLRGQGHRLARLGRADRLDRVYPDRRLHDRRSHRDGRRCPLAGSSRVGSGAGREQCEQRGEITWRSVSTCVGRFRCVISNRPSVPRTAIFTAAPATRSQLIPALLASNIRHPPAMTFPLVVDSRLGAPVSPPCAAGPGTEAGRVTRQG